MMRRGVGIIEIEIIPFILEEFYNFVNGQLHFPSFINVAIPFIIKLEKNVLENLLYIRIKGNRDKNMAIKFCFKILK